MKHIILIMLLLSFSQIKLNAQNIQNANTNANANALANKIAKKMKDTLGLSSQQRNQIKDVNISLHDQKMAVRSQYTNRDSVSVKLQKIEKTRDSLYRPVLTQQQYDLYKQKKRNLVSNN